MPKVEAVHEIQRAAEPGKPATATSRAVAPKVQIIKAGDVFTVEGDEYEELKAAGAIKKPSPKGESVDHDNEAKKANLDPTASQVAETTPKTSRQTTKGAAKAAESRAAKAAKEAPAADANDGTGNDPAQGGQGESNDDLI